MIWFGIGTHNQRADQKSFIPTQWTFAYISGLHIRYWILFKALRVISQPKKAMISSKYIGTFLSYRYEWCMLYKCFIYEWLLDFLRKTLLIYHDYDTLRQDSMIRKAGWWIIVLFLIAILLCHNLPVNNAKRFGGGFRGGGGSRKSGGSWGRSGWSRGGRTYQTISGRPRTSLYSRWENNINSWNKMQIFIEKVYKWPFLCINWNQIQKSINQTQNNFLVYTGFLVKLFQKKPKW